MMKHALELSPVHQVLLEKSIKGYKEIEYEVMVLRFLDALIAGAEQFHAALIQDSLPVQFHGQIQPSLPTDSRHEGVRPFKPQETSLSI